MARITKFSKELENYNRMKYYKLRVVSPIGPNRSLKVVDFQPLVGGESVTMFTDPAKARKTMSDLGKIVLQLEIVN